MKINWSLIFAVLLVAIIGAILFFTPAKGAHAAGSPPVLPIVTLTDAQAFRTVGESPLPTLYTGFLEFRAPVWTQGMGRISGWKEVGQIGEIAGELKFNNLFGPVTPFVSGNYSFSQDKGFPYRDLKAGAEFAVNKDLTFFSYWQRWYTADVDRVYCGFRLNLRG